MEILHIQKRVLRCLLGKKCWYQNTYLFRLYSSTLAKKVILKLRLFSKKILKRIMWWWWWCILKQIFSFPSLSKRSKNKTKKINRWSFFSSAKILQEFMWWYMIIIFQLFRLFSARLCYISLIYFCYCAYIENPDTIS